MSRYAVGIPSNGSKVVDLLETTCSNSSVAMRLIVDKRMPRLESMIFVEFSYLVMLCDGKVPYPVYKSMKLGYPGLAQVHAYVGAKIKGTW